ncbi:hypothetical protein BDQ17DRAFT_787715 [Cyathus striatus]|nr:hypothetical protein BDQ17DRAFT_787715 [Cyathus striatus]
MLPPVLILQLQRPLILPTQQRQQQTRTILPLRPPLPTLQMLQIPQTLPPPPMTQQLQILLTVLLLPMIQQLQIRRTVLLPPMTQRYRFDGRCCCHDDPTSTDSADAAATTDDSDTDDSTDASAPPMELRRTMAQTRLETIVTPALTIPLWMTLMTDQPIQTPRWTMVMIPEMTLISEEMILTTETILEMTMTLVETTTSNLALLACLARTT